MDTTTDGQAASSPRPARTLPGGTFVLGVVVVAWIVTLTKYLRHRVLLSFDTVNNYAHVWYVADRLWTDGTVPLRMPILGHGHAWAFPYGFLPWLTAALARPVLGDWTVTLWLALGAVGMVVATFAAFPELRRGWWAAAVLVNPAVIQAALFGQLSFSWAATMLLFGVACWRQDRRVPAVVLVGLAQATHPAVVLPLAAILVLCWLPFEPQRRQLVGCYAISVLIAAPATVLALISPVFNDATARDIVVNFASTVGARSLAIALPVFFAVAARHVRWRAAGLCALGLAFVMNVGLEGPMRVTNGWQSLNRNDQAMSMRRFLQSPTFVRGRTYRVLRAGDAKLGLYRLLQAGGHIDSEFFPEGMAIRSFRSPEQYERLLCRREVDFVLAFDSYDRIRHTNEHQLLRQLDHRSTGAPVIRLARSSGDLDVFAVNRAGCKRWV